MDVASDMEVSLAMDLSVDGSQTMIFENPGSIAASNQVRVKRNRDPCHVQKKKVTIGSLNA